jgi:hypothetical protein
MKRFALFAAVAAISLSACTQPASEAKMALEAYGFTDIGLGGHAWFECGKDDNYGTEFVAVNAAGREVEGVVCSGFMKGATVRITAVHDAPTEGDPLAGATR